MQRIHHHWLWAVRVIAGCCLLIFPHQLTAQTCQVTCAVHLIQRDANTVNLVLIGPEVRRNSIAAHTASFDHLCPGNYRLRISGIGIQPVDTAFALQQSTELTIELMASVEQLQLFEVHDDRSDRTGAVRVHRRLAVAVSRLRDGRRATALRRLHRTGRDRPVG